MSEKKKKQRDVFIDAARELGCDESEERFVAALKRVGKHRATRPSTQPKKKVAD